MAENINPVTFATSPARFVLASVVTSNSSYKMYMHKEFPHGLEEIENVVRYQQSNKEMCNRLNA